MGFAVLAGAVEKRAIISGPTQRMLARKGAVHSTERVAMQLHRSLALGRI